MLEVMYRFSHLRSNCLLNLLRRYGYLHSRQVFQSDCRDSVPPQQAAHLPMKELRLHKREQIEWLYFAEVAKHGKSTRTNCAVLIFRNKSGRMGFLYLYLRLRWL
jgi:hypothetical protein